ncbi:MAG TPA: tetratricopeptide repeat protein [Chloroflexia bacterium]|nr:tetratricopeptide repeat protein [Chloroflexia bacterium]
MPDSAAKIALCIGINYKGADPRIPELHFAEADAAAMTALLQAQGFQVTSLLGVQATGQAIGDALKATAALPAELCVLYLSGHGLHGNGALDQGRVYFAPFDFKPDVVPLPAIALVDLAQAFESRFLAQNAFALFDCCYAGTAAAISATTDWSADAAQWRTQLAQKDDGTPRGDAIASDDNAPAAADTRCRALIAACPGNVAARELVALGHGVATYYALEGWAGKAADLDSGLVTAARLYTYINDRLFYDQQLPPPARSGGTGDVVLNQVDPAVAGTTIRAGCTVFDGAAFAGAWARAAHPGAVSLYDRPGQQLFWQIVASQDMRRDVIDPLRRAIGLVEDQPGMRFQLITSAPAYGKSILLLRLQYELAALDGRYVLAPAKEGPPTKEGPALDGDALEALCQEIGTGTPGRPGRRVYLVLDNAYRFHSELLNRLSSRPIPNLTILAGARPTDLPRNAPRPAPALPVAPTASPSAPNYDPIVLAGLSEREAEKLVDKVRTYGTLQPDAKTILAPYIGAPDGVDRSLLLAVINLTTAGGMPAYVGRRLQEVNNGRDPTQEDPTKWEPFMQIYYWIAICRDWGAYVPQLALPALTGLRAADVDSLLCDCAGDKCEPTAMARAYLRGECQGTWRTDHQVVAAGVVAVLCASEAPHSRFARLVGRLASIPTPAGAQLAGQLLSRFAANPQLLLSADTPSVGSVLDDPAVSAALATLRSVAEPGDLLNEYGRAYILLGRYDDALLVGDAIVGLADQGISLPIDVVVIAHVGRGLVYAYKRRYEEAIAEYTTALAILPGHAAVVIFNFRAAAYSRLGKYSDALADFNSALALSPDDPAVLTNRGITCLRMGLYGEALANFFHALHARHDDPTVLNNRGIVYSHLKRFDWALADFSRSLEIRPGNARALLNRANTYRRMRRYDEALADYQQVLAQQPASYNALNNRGATYRRLRRYADAAADFTAALAVRPKDPADALYNRGTAYYYMGQDHRADALADFTASLATQPAQPTDPVLQRKRAATLTNRGATYKGLGRYPEALADYNESLALWPLHGRTLYNRACTYRHLGTLDAALADFTAALAVQPDDPRALNNRGLTLHNLGRNQEALDDFTRSIALRPAVGRAYYNRGATYYRLGRFAEALADFNQVLALQPDYVPALNNRGAVLEELGQYDAALADYTRVLQLQPDQADTFHNRGLTLVRLQRYAEALADYTQSLTLRADHPETLHDRAEVYYYLEQYDEALADLARILTLRATDFAAFHLRGRVYYRLTRYDDALADFTAALAAQVDDVSSLQRRGLTYTRLTRYDEARQDFTRALELRPDHPPTLYGLACLYSLRGEVIVGLTFLKDLIRLDSTYRTRIQDEPSLAALRNDPGFASLVAG